MKVVTWNLGYNTDASKHEDAWRYLIDELDADIAFLQEVRVPEDVEASGRCIFTTPTTPQWGSAILVKQLAATQLPLPGARRRQAGAGGVAPARDARR